MPGISGYILKAKQFVAKKGHKICILINQLADASFFDIQQTNF